MRIEAYTQVQQLYQNRKVTKTQQAGSVSHADQVQISSLGKAAVAAAPDVREDVVASVKTRIQDGTYSVETGSFVEKLLKKYEEMR